MDKVKQFIEEHIDELDNPNSYSDIYFAAYDEFNNSEFAEFNTIMHDVLGINVSEYQDKVLRFVLTMSFEDWVSGTLTHRIPLPVFQAHYLFNRCGMSWNEFEDFVLSTDGEYDDIRFDRDTHGAIVVIKEGQ